MKKKLVVYNTNMSYINVISDFSSKYLKNNEIREIISPYNGATNT